MVLTVHVVGDGTANGHRLGAGCHGQHPAMRHHQPLNISQQNARLTNQAAGLVIERNEMIQPGSIPKGAARIQADVSVTAAHTTGYTGMRPGADNILDSVRIAQVNKMVRMGSEPPPRRNRYHAATIYWL